MKQILTVKIFKIWYMAVSYSSHIPSKQQDGTAADSTAQGAFNFECWWTAILFSYFIQSGNTDSIVCFQNPKRTYF